ncbi:hypothetical protein PG990_005491 [Apiospora arundinis]
MTGWLLSRWPCSARAARRLGYAVASVRGTSNSQKVTTSMTGFSTRELGSHHKPEADPQREAPEPMLFGNGKLGSRDLDSGGEIAAFYRKQNMASAYHMRSIRVQKPKISGVSVLVSPRHCFDSNHMKYLDKFEHPMRKTMFDMYASWADRPLWCNGGAYGEKPIVNSKAKRWIQRGIREALLARGYDRDGRPLQKTSVGAAAASSNTKGGKAAPAALYGTLKVFTRTPKVLCSHSFSDVLEAMKQALAAAEPFLSGNGNGNRETRNQPARINNGTSHHKQGNRSPVKPGQASKKPLSWI